MLCTDGANRTTAVSGQVPRKARDTIDPSGNINFITVTPSAFSVSSFILSPTLYSAIAFASAASCGGSDLSSADIANINKRTTDIQAFFNASGGWLYRSGAGDRSAYYASVPIPAAAVAVSPPFTLTSIGKRAPFNLIEGSGSDDNCCATHNSFTLPGPGSPLLVLETDGSGFAETLAAGNVSISGGGFTGPPGAVPEPSSYVLMLAGLGCLATLGRAQTAPRLIRSHRRTASGRCCG